MELKDSIGLAATICTIATFLSGTEICRKIWKNKSTKDVSPLPFLCGLINCAFWLRYGVLIEDSAIIIVNLTGTILQSLYICWYRRYNVMETFNMQLLLVMLILGFFYIFTSFFVIPENARYIAGISSSIASVVFMASPLTSLARVLETKNVESLPFPLILCTFVMASLWFFYGFLAADAFVQVPNVLGAILSFSQLCVYVAYRDTKKKY